MKSFYCPVCNKEIIIGEELEQLINNLNKTIGNMPLFFKRGIGIRQTCKNCNSKLEFNWQTKAFKKINWIREFCRELLGKTGKKA